MTSLPISRRSLLACSAGLLLAGCATTPQPRTAPTGLVEVQILGLNDFHGNLETPAAPVDIARGDGSKLTTRAGGAAALAATLQRLRAGHPSVTVAAGDLIGASPLTSAYFLDEPSIRALSMAGLEVASVGNHEFDKGAAELTRMQRGGCDKHTSRVPCRLEPFAGAGFTYLAANVVTERGTTLFPATTVKQVGPVRVGFIGMTLKETQTLVTPAGVAGLRFTDEAATANALVPTLRAQGADVIVLLFHQGGRVPDVYREHGCNGLSGDLLPILDKLDPSISIVVSGHTHQAYACQLQAGGAQRLVTSAGKNGYLVTDIRLTYDPSAKRLLKATAENVPVVGEAADPAITALVNRYAAAARPAAERPVGKLAGPALKDAEDGESPAAALIADAQLAATRPAGRGGAQLSFINASGVRTDLKPRADGTITYGDIFALQPFGNNLVVKTLTGAQLKALLEQQFKVEGGKIRVGSLLVPSAGFAFAYDLARPDGQRITAATLNGRPIDPAARYRVTVNNFLASGGDGFSVLAQGTDAFDAGLDLDALEAWLATNPPLPKVGRVRTAATAG
ncbi:bifunctional metallophosphatase/5'-nucleotidase [Sphingomonas sp. BN140010]|uniref:Bifunctional metallophosphatase/5'-nucleotidase n=1 Tax=Sphingomonas arvum TaxID=2992113 RepID=A0ABT3JI23_9SPHN|nr:bifunctional metallophosphatase/5'-nucleotidase [Sphingomonas sp. BN140010]MCW3798702.1 bifunctional metallophosphatase/5'-nucleotidase [Sphingomonas sp. BN140010]